MSKKILLLFMLLGSVPLFAQSISSVVPLQRETIPSLSQMFDDIFGPHGLIVDSEEQLPDGSSHSGHFNSAFQSEFAQFDIAIASQLTTLPIPSPASGFTYKFDSSTGTFVRTTQSFGPIMAERAETIGKGKFTFGFGYQHFRFTSLDSIDLSRVPAVFTHDDAELGGGRSDIITTTNTIDASVAQFTTFLTYGVADRLDVSVAVPFVRTHISLLSDAVIQRIGTTDPKIHFFRDPANPTSYGNERQYFADNTAVGLGDIVVRLKGTLVRHKGFGLALGTDVRAPSGDEKNLLGAGALGVKPFVAASYGFRRISPHANVAYLWNGKSELAGDVRTGRKADLPDQVIYIAGADLGVNARMTLAVDFIGQTVLDSPRMVATTFHAANGLTFPSITFRSETFTQANLGTGIKLNLARQFLIDFSLLTKLNEPGLRAKVTPLLGFECSF